MDVYFEVIHPDFPVLHEPSFRDAYEAWDASKTGANPTWLCSALCVLILARRVADIDIPVEAEKRWWKHIQTLLPTVIFSSTRSTIQALSLIALHLHNTSHRDACWNVTGMAIRVAHAIGMHRGDIRNTEGRLNQELRRRVWWTLYTFEQMQVSSHDRPSAILHTSSAIEAANERVLGSTFAPEYAEWSRKLTIILGSACNTLTHSNMLSLEDLYGKPLSPVATILRDLTRWKACLPTHLRWGVLDSLASSQQRPLILLHIQYDYVVILVTRTALLHRATLLMQNPAQSIPDTLAKVSETCIDAGHSLGDALRRLESLHKLNSGTWFDFFYMVAASLVLVLADKVKPHDSEHATDSLLRDLAQTATTHLNTKRIPATMRALALIVVEVSASVSGSNSVDPLALRGKALQEGIVHDTSSNLAASDQALWQSIDEMDFLQTFPTDFFNWTSFDL
jgi:hypothetical protein